MDSALTTVGLPIALAIIMFGLGLDLTTDDFRRVGRHPRAVAIALACQLVLLPILCFGLVVLFDLPPLLGIGMMLLAASPGGTTANLFSHLFRGDVALNITLTAVNSVISVVTLPLITSLAISYYDRSDSVSVPFSEVVKVFAIILVPVGIGMLVRARSPRFAARMDRPVRIGSAVVLAVLVLGILLDERDNVGDYLADVGLVALIFCAPEPGGGVRRAARLRRGRRPGHRVVDGDRRAQRHAGHLHRPRGARGGDHLGPGGGVLADHVPARGALGLAGVALGQEPAGGRRPVSDAATSGAISRSARPRWEIRSFSAGSSSAEVSSGLVCSSATNTTS